GAIWGLLPSPLRRLELQSYLPTTTAEEVMNLSPTTTAPSTLAQDVLLLMNVRSKPITSLFVVGEDGRPQGIIHLHDLLRAGLA
ncbi:MAG: CBS domain-containing protein, partial [Gluconobacter sp.]